jgi:PAS domain S-box-containing protein
MMDDSTEELQLHILHLEDAAADAELTRRELSHAGLNCEILHVDNQDGFRKGLLEFKPDIILSDYVLPRFTGADALAIALQLAPLTPFIMVTSSINESTAVECIKAGAWDYVIKEHLTRLAPAIAAARATWKDRKEKAEALEDLRDSEERFRRFTEASFEGVSIIGDGLLLDASPNYARMFGHTLEEMIGRSVLEWMAPESREIVRQYIQQGWSAPYEAIGLRKDGTRFVAEICGREARYHGRTVRISAIHDITARKQAEEEARKLAAFPRWNPNPVFEFAAEGRMAYCNAAAHEMARSLGCASPEELMPPNTAGIIAECLRTGRNKLRLETQRNERTISWSFFPIPQMQVVHCYAGEITERLNLEEQLRQSQKMESIGQLAAGVAHDFNNLLTVIQGHAGLIQSDPNLSAESVESLRHITTASHRAADLTHQLLAFSRKQLMELRVVAINEVLDHVLDMLGRVIGEHISLQVSREASLPGVCADAGMVEQVIMNLAVNARDAMPEGGVLRLATSLFIADAAFVRQQPEARPGRHVCLTVSDTGCGIDPSIIGRIFDPFFTTKAVGKGTGLGLATVYGIIKQHGGWIDVESQVGVGTTFRVYWPENLENQTCETIPPPASDAPKGRETLLVVEDDDFLRELELEILSRQGYRVYAAKNGHAALELWNTYSDQIEMLLTDMVMPDGISGRQLAERLWEKRPQLKVLFATGYSYNVQKKEIPDRDGVAFIQKPFQAGMLAQAVKDCLQGNIVRHI